MAPTAPSARTLPPSLTELANRHGSDKGTLGPSEEWGAHNYTDLYEAYLTPLRDRKIRLLEIGLGVTGPGWKAKIVHGRNRGGASIRMWRDYFPRARIYGIDVNPASFLDNDRVSTHVADQGDIAALGGFTEATAGVRFDVIIDDGSHRPDHQQISLGYLIDWLAPGGLYFIEDLMANGRGDDAGGRMASEDVVNTRTVLRGLRDEGRAPAPNALPDPEGLLAQLDHIGLHAPRPVHNALASGKRRRARQIMRFEPGSERLAALRKRRGPASAA